MCQQPCEQHFDRVLAIVDAGANALTVLEQRGRRWARFGLRTHWQQFALLVLVNEGDRDGVVACRNHGTHVVVSTLSSSE